MKIVEPWTLVKGMYSIYFMKLFMLNGCEVKVMFFPSQGFNLTIEVESLYGNDHVGILSQRVVSHHN